MMSQETFSMKQHGTDPVREQAAAWFARVQDAPRDAGLQKQLRAWLASDERHREEYEHLDRVWQAAAFIPRQRLKRCASQTRCSSCHVGVSCARRWPPVSRIGAGPGLGAAGTISG
jgi:transmembrane sensor